MSWAWPFAAAEGARIGRQCNGDAVHFMHVSLPHLGVVDEKSALRPVVREFSKHTGALECKSFF